MAYDTLKGLIRQYIKTNGQNEITGQILQNVLIAMVDEYPSLTGYATQQWVQSQGYLTDADLSNFATQTWVEAQLLGYLPTSTSLINAVVQSADGSMKFSGRNFADTYLDFTHTHRFEELTDIPTLLQDFGITGGTLSGLTVNNATVNNTLVITNGNDYVSIAGEGITIVDEDAGTFNVYMSSAGYMAVDTSIVASSFIKNGGTSSQFLKADGSVDSNAYITSAALTGYATQSWVNTQLLGYLPTSTTLINNVIKSDDGTLKFAGRNFTDTYLDFTHTHRFEELTDIPTLLQDFGITGGTLSELTVNNATVNNTLAITNGNDYVSIAGEGITIVDEDAGTFNIYMSSAGYMSVDTSIVASAFIKTGGTSSQFLKADGSVDSNAYITSSALTGYATQSWVNTQLAGYLPLTGGTLTGDLTVGGIVSAEGVWVEDSGHSAIIISNGGISIDDGVTISGNTISLYGGTSSQFLKADGSVDSNTYATQSWVGQQGFITSAALSGYATESWVNTQLLGYLPTSTILINSVIKSDDGTLKFAGRNFADTYIDFTHTHRFEELTDIPTLLQDFGITGGTLSGLTVNNATVNNTLVITNGNDYVSIAGEGITIVDEDAGTFNVYMSSAGYMAVDTSIVASSFIKNGGTSSQFLKADGSVDSNAYITSAALTGYATQSWVNTQLGGYLPTSTALVNTLAKSADGSMKFSGRNFADTYIDFTHDHRWEEIVDRPNIEIGGAGMTYTDGKFGVGIKVPSYPIDVDGSIRATSFVNSSDARLKDIEDYDADISAEAVSMAPAVHYQWKNRKNETARVGSIAQYWQNLIPEAVSKDDKGYLSMQYDVIALISAISIAKRTVDHERRIAELESENAQLRLELNRVKEAIKTT